MERSEGESGESTWRQVGINRQETLYTPDMGALMGAQLASQQVLWLRTGYSGQCIDSK